MSIVKSKIRVALRRSYSSIRERLKSLDCQMFDDRMVQYLQLIQEPVGRMSTTSAVIKGFAVTAAVSIVSIAVETKMKGMLPFSLLLMAAFVLMDAYYFSIERRYRYLYQQVLDGNHPVDFSMKLRNDPVSKYEAKARITDCIFSLSIAPFYSAVILFLVSAINLL